MHFFNKKAVWDSMIFYTLFLQQNVNNGYVKSNFGYSSTKKFEFGMTNLQKSNRP